MFVQIKYFLKRYRLLKKLNFGNGQNEFFLVSYPKSGNTWVRFLLAQLLSQSKDEEINLKNINEYIPDTHTPKCFRSVNGHIFNSLPKKIIKAHDPYFFFYKSKKIIYLVRDGRDVINSYYHFISFRHDDLHSIKDFILNRVNIPFGSWSKHVASWHFGRCKKKIIIQYEDMLRDPQREINKILLFLNYSVSKDDIEQAIKSSKFKNLKKIELRHGHMNSLNHKKDKGAYFFRKGIKGDFKNTFTKEDEALFQEIHGTEMKLYNYY